MTMKHVYEIAKIKSQDPSFSRIPLESVCKTVVGAAKSLGISIVRSDSTRLAPATEQ